MESRRTYGTLAVVVLGALTILVVGGVWLDRTVLHYGAWFGYPDAPPVPSGASVVVQDRGWDDDNPIRIRVQVVDAGSMTAAGLTAFYRSAYPHSDGWTERPRPGFTMCLVNRATRGYSQIMTVQRYRGTRVPAESHHFLVAVSRTSDQLEGACGIPNGWIPGDLLRSAKDPSASPQ